MKRKLLLFVLALLLIPTLMACDQRPTIRILAPGEYMSKKFMSSFTKEHGIRISIQEFASNEEALTFIKSDKVYDLILPSDYALEQLIVEDQGYIKKVDWSKITTFDKEKDLSDGLDDILDKLKTEANVDLLEYGVPYFWGSVGILYYSNKVSEEHVNLGWDLLRQGDKYNVAFYDSSRDGLMAGLISLGYSMNSNVASEIEEATEWLKVGTSKENVGYVTDNVFDDIPSGVYDLAMVYTGDAAEIMEQMIEEEDNYDLKFTKPIEGSNIWVDFMVLHSKGNEEYAYLFLNHLMSYQGSLDNTDAVYYISPREDVRLKQIDKASTDAIKELFQITLGEKDDIFRFDPVSKKLIDDAWNSIGVRR